MDIAAPLALLHPFPMDARFWSAAATSLEADRQLIIPEFPGLGEATPLAEPSIDGHADAVAAQIAREAPGGRAVVCGISLGGYVALSLAVRHPERVAALVLADTRAEADTPEAREERIAGAALVRAQGTAPFLDDLAPKLVAEGDRRSLAAARAIADAQSPEGVASALEALAARPDRVADLPSITTPTLVLVGEADALTPLPFAQTLAEGIPGAELTVIAGAGHLTALERPERFADAVREFLAERRI
jgi:3-oxoadipate enol-lactonase